MSSDDAPLPSQEEFERRLKARLETFEKIQSAARKQLEVDPNTLRSVISS